MTVISGDTEAAFTALADVFRANFTDRGETGAALAVYHRGEKVADLWGGSYTADTVQIVRSVTKGVVAIVAHLLAERGVLDFDVPIAAVWPEYSAAGPIRWLFTHQAGMSAVDAPLTLDDVIAWEPVAAALAAQTPSWEPGTDHGYHALTYGWLTGEVLRRVTGSSVGSLVQSLLCEPLGLALWIGLPSSEEPRAHPLVPAPPADPSQPDPLATVLSDPSSLAARSFSNPPLFAHESEPAYLGAEVPAANGVTNARSLARLYAATVGPVDGVRLLSGATLAAAMEVQASGPDRVIGFETRYGTGFQRPFPMRPMAGVGTPCVGHYGMGGPLAFAHPDLELGFAYTTVQIQNHPGPDPRTRLLAETAVACAEALA